MPNTKNIFTKTSCLVCLLALISCTPTNKLKYVVDEGADVNKNEFNNDRSEKTIQPFDYLYIKIFSLDQRTNEVFNNQSNNMESTELLSYSVDEKGDITVPFIGTINVKGLTINEARDKIEKSLAVYLNNISVVVRFVSNKITLLGEVNHPGEYPFYDEKVTVFQALGFAGGSTSYGNLTNVTLIREKDNVIKYHYLDLTKKNIASSEFYYLLPNDVLIINPINAKYRDLNSYSLTTLSTVFSAIASLLWGITLYKTLK